MHEECGIEGFLRREVLPYAPDAWYVPKSVKVGYEISFNRYFYKPEPMRTLEEIRADILAVETGDGGVVRRDLRSWSRACTFIQSVADGRRIGMALEERIVTWSRERPISQRDVMRPGLLSANFFPTRTTTG